MVKRCKETERMMYSTCKLLTDNNIFGCNFCNQQHFVTVAKVYFFLSICNRLQFLLIELVTPQHRSYNTFTYVNSVGHLKHSKLSERPHVFVLFLPIATILLSTAIIFSLLQQCLYEQRTNISNTATLCSSMASTTHKMDFLIL